MTDAELARRALAGSQAAFRTLVARYASAAINVAMRLVNDRTLAEDVAQEAFVRAFARLETFDPERRFSAWFFRILHNVAVDHLRRRRVNVVSLEAIQADGYAGPAADPSTSSPDAEAERSALAAALSEALGRIRVEYREAIILKYHQGLTVEEIGDILKVPAGTVKTYLHRGRKALAAILSTTGWHP